MHAMLLTWQCMHAGAGTTRPFPATRRRWRTSPATQRPGSASASPYSPSEGSRKPSAPTSSPCRRVPLRSLHLSTRIVCQLTTTTAACTGDELGMHGNCQGSVCRIGKSKPARQARDDHSYASERVIRISVFMTFVALPVDYLHVFQLRCHIDGPDFKLQQHASKAKIPAASIPHA